VWGIKYGDTFPDFPYFRRNDHTWKVIFIINYSSFVILRNFIRVYYLLIFLNGIQLNYVFFLLCTWTWTFRESLYRHCACCSILFVYLYYIYLYMNKTLFRSKHLDPQCCVLIRVFCFCFHLAPWIDDSYDGQC
jgi:hypothetical protein